LFCKRVRNRSESILGSQVFTAGQIPERNKGYDPEIRQALVPGPDAGQENRLYVQQLSVRV
jgi:hypothetical protein